MVGTCGNDKEKEDTSYVCEEHAAQSVKGALKSSDNAPGHPDVVLGPESLWNEESTNFLPNVWLVWGGNTAVESLLLSDVFWLWVFMFMEQKKQKHDTEIISPLVL